MPNIRTRSEIDCPIYGSPCLFNESKLPTTADVLKHVLFIRNKLKSEKNGKQPAISEVFEIAGYDLIEVWSKASLPIVTIQRVKQLLQSCYDKYLHFIRFPKSKQTENFKSKLQQ